MPEDYQLPEALTNSSKRQAHEQRHGLWRLVQLH